MVKFLKIFSITLMSIILVLYSAFLFVVPNFIDINKYEPQIKQAVQESTGFIINTEDIKLSTGWNLSAGLKAGRVDFLYPNNEKFFQANNFEIKLSLIPLLMKNIIIDSINTDNLILRMKVNKDGSFYIEKFLPKSETQNNEESQVQTELPFGLKISDIMPVICAKKYSISLIDSQTNKTYTVSGNDFKISDFILNDKIKIQTNGQIILEKEKQITYDINLFSKVMPEFAPNNNLTQTETSETFNILYYLKALKTINLLADIKADLKLTGDIDNIKTDGNLDITGFSLKVKNSQLPESYIKTTFSGNKVSINSNLNTSKTENINLNGFLKYGKNPYIDLTTKSDKISLSNMFDIISSLLPVFGMDEFKGITANGDLKANFTVKSDFKKIDSNGYLKINNANVFYNAFNIAVKEINSDIDFSKNQINIKNSSASVNGAPITLAGAINSNAYANLSIKADKLPIKGLFATFGLVNILKDNSINSGIITLDGKLKGNLTKTKPQINVLLENVNIYNKPLKTSLTLNNGKSDITFSDDNKINGNILVTALKIKSNDFGSYSLPSTKLSFDDKDFNIQPSAIYFNNSKIDFKGKISNYADKNNLVNIQLYGLILANDLKSLVPKEFKNDISVSGKLPFILRINGNLNAQTITGQVLSNQSNYFSYGTVKSLYNKTTLLNLVMNLANNNLKITDLSLNALNTNKGLSENFNSNLSGSTRIATISGAINHLQNKYPSINNLKISMPSTLSVSIPTLKSSDIQVNGYLNVNGNTLNPAITGQLILPVITLPTLKTTVKNLNIVLNKNNINVNCPTLVVADSQIALTSTIGSNFNKGIKIKSMDLNAIKLNLDTMLAALSNLPQNSVGQGTDIGVTLSNGRGKIDKFSLGGLNASNITSDFNINDNILKLSNITGYAYNGKIAGDAEYNIIFGNLKINLQGRGLSAEPALHDFTGISNLLSGSLDFDTNNIKLIAGTESQMMQSLKGDVTFIVLNGQMGTLGKLENLLYAQNILGNNLLKNSLGSITKAVSIKKTGDFKYLKGKMSFLSGWANINTFQTSGPAMSMYVTGKYNLLNNTINASVLGRLSNDVVEVLGPIGEFSVNKLLSYIPKIGQISSTLINEMTIKPSGENLTMLPDLTPKQTGETKAFKVILNGGVDKTSSIKSFKWISNPSNQEESQNSKSSETSQTQNENQNSSAAVQSQNNSQTGTTPSSQPISGTSSTNLDNLKQNIKDSIINKTTESLNNKIQSQSTTESSNSQSTTTQTQQKQKSVADFINNLPDLKIE